jgi:hypothetical protein
MSRIVIVIKCHNQNNVVTMTGQLRMGSDPMHGQQNGPSINRWMDHVLDPKSDCKQELVLLWWLQ